MSCQRINAKTAPSVVQIIHDRGKKLISSDPEQVVGDLARARAHYEEVQTVWEVLPLYWSELLQDYEPERQVFIL